MVVKSNGKIVYDSWKDGSDLYKDQKGYYILLWNPKIEKYTTYKKYLAKSWKPTHYESKKSTKKKSTKIKSTKKNKNIILYKMKI